MEYLAEKIVNEDLSVRQAEAAAQQMTQGAPKKAARAADQARRALRRRR